MGEEKDPAIPAVRQTSSQLRLASQNAPKGKIVLQDQMANFTPAVPVRSEREMLLDFYCKKPRFSLIILILGMSSLYSIGAAISRGRARTTISSTPRLLPTPRCASAWFSRPDTGPLSPHTKQKRNPYTPSGGSI
jgi:hypothetical protein